MTFNTVTRHLKEGGKNVVRNGWMSFASVSSIVISLFILGVFMLLSLNVNVLTQQIENQVQVRVFLNNIDKKQIELLEVDIGNMSEVSKVTFVSKADGMKLLQESLGEDGKDLLSGYTDATNPLPDSFTVEVYEPKTIAIVAKKIAAVNETNSAKPILKVQYGKGTVEKLFTFTDAVESVGLIIVIGLGITAMFLISNTIKVTIMARQREISIMKLVGATNSFIRWPFFIEGALLGLLGSLVTIGILFFGYYRLVYATNIEMGLMMIKLLPLQDIWLSVGGIILGLGVVIGIWGSMISIRKFLKV
ncbi:permease-like cell division protein FtsX [Paenibacillus sp. 481]|uniref:permease-like cell division protein FtsX n=1 Tax=Paenibacillus sp. 481 TaxID=2835869 RepID=UPI001E40ED31|nr:permease-like cell division protein FtsX [Paenibacillus sp. 481]UHA75734.1 permease-like cell division protein FtsX [Paenibacillus sp. 481]